jgi:hypothetical protein
MKIELANFDLIPKRKEVITMTYAKPDLVLLADAQTAIQSGSGSDGSGDGVKENLMTEAGQPIQSPPAYEADE